MSTYIIEREPNKYGGNQQAYTEKVDKIVADTADAFHQAVETKQDLIQLFHQTLASFEKTRHQIAVEQGTENSERFGSRRDKKENFPGPFGLTTFCRPYHEYNKSVLPVIQKQLKTMKYTHKGFQQTESEIVFEECLGRKSKMEFSIVTEDALKKWPNPFTEKEYLRFCKICNVTPVKSGSILE